MTNNDADQNSPEDSEEQAYPIDVLRLELQHLEREAIADVDITDGVTDSLRAELSQRLESQLVDTLVAGEIEYLLAAAPKMSDDQAVALRRGAHRAIEFVEAHQESLGRLHAELEALVEGASGLDDALDEVLAGFTDFVDRLERGPVRFEEIDANEVARWVVDLGAPRPTVLAALDPRHHVGATTDSADSPMLLVGAGDNNWDEFRHRVWALTDSWTQSSRSSIGESLVDAGNGEHGKEQEDARDIGGDIQEFLGVVRRSPGPDQE